MRPTFTEFMEMEEPLAMAMAEHLPMLDDGLGRKLQGLTSTLMALVGRR